MEKPFAIEKLRTKTRDRRHVLKSTLIIGLNTSSLIDLCIDVQWHCEELD